MVTTRMPKSEGIRECKLTDTKAMPRLEPYGVQRSACRTVRSSYAGPRQPAQPEQWQWQWQWRLTTARYRRYSGTAAAGGVYTGSCTVAVFGGWVREH